MTALQIKSAEIKAIDKYSNTMKAIICTKYGSPKVLQPREVEKPIPQEDEILIKIHATSATSGDARIRQANPFLIRLLFGFRKPRNPILGVIVAGEIVAKGKDVTTFKVGDKVYGSTEMNFGTYAQYVTMPDKGALTLIPDAMSFSAAAAIPFGATAARYFLQKANIKNGHKVLIYGASGALGTAAIQIAKYYGARVTAVCSRRNFDLVKNLGAEKVIDYRKEDFTQRGEKYDVIFETVGKSNLTNNLKSLKASGVLLMASASFWQMLRGLFSSILSRKKVIAGYAEVKAQDMKDINQLIKDGYLQAVIDRCYPLDKLAEAHSYVDTGRKRGNVVIEVEH